MKRLLLSLTLLAALPVLATPSVFASYEKVRQSFLSGSLKDVQNGARQLAAEARTAKLLDVAGTAEAVAKSPDLAKARVAFAAVSDKLIEVRKNTKGARPAVYYCPMVDKSWLQAKGKVGNPYDPAMQMCGALKEE